MGATLTEQQRLIVESAERMAADGRSSAQKRLQDGSWPAEPDNALLSDWSGLGIPESKGGNGGGLLDLALVIKTLAGALAPNRFTSHVAAMQVADAAGLSLGGALHGTERWCLATSEPDTDPQGPFRCRMNNGMLAGRKTGVPDGYAADAAVVILADDAVAVAEPSGRHRLTSANPLNDTADLDFDDVKPKQFGPGSALGMLRATVLVAADLCGLARGAVDLGAEYAQDRVQFGKPIGAFQGVAHQLADALVAAETAWSLTLYACWALDNATPDAAKAIHAAKARASEAAIFSAERALHVHGGMGMTWEAVPHLYLRRALAASAWLGGPHWHRRRVGTTLLEQHRNKNYTRN